MEQVVDLRDASRVVTSLDRAVGEENDTALGDLIPSEDAAPEEEVYLQNQQDVVREVVANLPDLDRRVIQMRYGLNGDREPQTLTRIGEELGVSARPRLPDRAPRAGAPGAAARDALALRSGVGAPHVRMRTNAPGLVRFGDGKSKSRSIASARSSPQTEGAA